MRGEISYGRGAIIESRSANLLKAQCFVKLVRHKIGGLNVHFADDPGVTETNGALEQLVVEHSGQAASPPFLCNHHTVDVEEPALFAAKPKKMAAVVIISVFKCDQQRCSRRDEQRDMRRSDQLVEALRGEQ